MNDTLIGSFKSREYDGVKVYELDNNWNLCHHKDILFMSSSSLLIEDGIRQLNNEISLLDNTEFTKVQSTKSTFAGAISTPIILIYQSYFLKTQSFLNQTKNGLVDGQIGLNLIWNHQTII